MSERRPVTSIQVRTSKQARNNAMSRIQMVVNVTYPSSLPAPSEQQIKAKIAEIHDTLDLNLIVLFGFQTKNHCNDIELQAVGEEESWSGASGFCLIYDSMDDLVRLEPRHRRNKLISTTIAVETTCANSPGIGASTETGQIETSDGDKEKFIRRKKNGRSKNRLLSMKMQLWTRWKNMKLPGKRIVVCLMVGILCLWLLQKLDFPIFNPVTRMLASSDSSRVSGFVSKGEWPYTLKDHPEEFETIIHPGDNRTKIMVPKFWASPIHRNYSLWMNFPLFVRQMGTCAGETRLHGANCPLDNRTIFVGIASYRDFECRQTVTCLLERAKNPGRIRVGVVDQIVPGLDVACDVPIKTTCHQDPQQALCRFAEQVDVLELEAELSLGPVFARHLTNRMYRGEYYALQTDAHITFVQDWDEDIISQMEATRNEMAVLSTYLTDVKGNIDENGKSLIQTRPIMCNSYFFKGGENPHVIHDSQPEHNPTVHGSPQLSPWWGAGFSFSRGHFLVNVPYDMYLPMIFQGEEMLIAIRGFTVGYDFYAPERSVCFHHYHRKDIPTLWDNEDNYEGFGPKSMKRLLGVVHMNPEKDPRQWDHREEETYGIGVVRTPEKFYKTFGLDVKQKTFQKHLCDFVDSGEMHRLFFPKLRPDGMGIDYSLIDYEFKDPRPGQDDETGSTENSSDESDE